MPEWIVFLPILLPILGALVYRLAAPRISPRIQIGLVLVLLALEIIGILVNIAPVNHRLVISNWQLASFTLVLQMDGIAVLLLLMLFVVLTALWLVNPPRAPLDPAAVLVWTAASILILAGNLVTIYFAWVLLDLAIFIWRLARDVERPEAVRALAISELAGFALYAGTQYIGTPFAGGGLALIGLAFWARLGLFPLHWVLPMRGVDSRDLWSARGVPMLAGASLWLRWATLQGPPPWQIVILLAIPTLIVALVWVWREQQPARIAIVCIWHGVALIPVAVAYGGASGIALALWLVSGIAFATALFEMALRWRAENRNRWPRLVWFAGLLAVAGMPLTPAFLGRIGLFVSLWESPDLWTIFLIGAVTLLILPPLWRMGQTLEGTEKRDPTRMEYAGLGLLTAGWIALSVAALPLAHALGPETGDSADQAMQKIIWTNDVVGIVISVAMTLLPALLALWLAGRLREFHPQPHSLIPRVANAIDLDWFAMTVTGIGYEMGVIARNLSAVVEENPTVWILLVALWIAIFIILPH